MSHTTESIRVATTDRKEAQTLFPGMTYTAIFSALVNGFKRLPASDQVEATRSVNRPRTHRSPRSRRAAAS